MAIKLFFYILMMIITALKTLVVLTVKYCLFLFNILSKILNVDFVTDIISVYIVQKYIFGINAHLRTLVS